ncbi:MAG: PEP/pyruvate-binding domain-containing protein [Thermodesulfobacteriota bacterium]
MPARKSSAAAVRHGRRHPAIGNPHTREQMERPDHTPAPATDGDFHLYHDLMSFKVKDILLVHTPYDAFIMEGNGSLAARIVNEYHGLNLSRPPRLHLATTVEAALDRLGRQRFDLVLTMPVVASVDGFALAARIRELRPRLPIYMLTHNPVGAEVSSPAGTAPSMVDRTWVWSGDADLLLAIVKNLEDHRNVRRDTARAAVRVILLVEDDPAFRSWFLPRMYREVVRQTQAVLAEGLNEEHRLQKMRARPKILVAGDYETALALFHRHRAHIFSVIADTRFPRKGKVDPRAGLRLLERIRRDIADLPLLLLSSEAGNRHHAEGIGVSFLGKNDTGLGEKLHRYFIDHLGFGDFVFRTPHGAELGRAGNMISFARMLATIDTASLRYHAAGNHLSNWVMARAEVGLALRLRRSALAALPDDELRRRVCAEVRDMLRRRQQGVIISFDPRGYDAELADFVRAGDGQLGGKALGLAFLAGRLTAPGQFGDAITVTIPRTFVLASDLFDAFLAANDLTGLEQLEDDAAIDRRCLAARLPEPTSQALAALLSQIDRPLIVRSSSTLEDAHTTPYAGLFTTRVLPNNDPDFATRLLQLGEAVKLVYASAFHHGPRAFAAGHRQRPLSRIGPMAVMIQQLAGVAHGGFFYPALSGVAQSRNFYPLPPMRPEDGIVLLALGFGNTVVEGGKCLRFCPRHPRVLPQFATVDDVLANSQSTFFALPLADTAGSAGDHPAPLVNRPANEAAAIYPQLFSWYSPEDHAIRDQTGTGHPLLTFRPLLQQNHSPLTDALLRLLAIGRTGMGCEVELEFAVDLAGGSPRLSVLQLRPMLQGGTGRAVHLSEAEKDRAFCRSRQVLGRGRLETVTDILYVRQRNFTAGEARLIVRTIAAFNGAITREQRRFLLVGPGRWGSMDPHLGIPVRWQDISGVMAIVELPLAERRIDPSQGTHFFQNITALGLPYLTIDRRLDHIDSDWFESSPAVRDEKSVRHLRPTPPLWLKVDSTTSEAALFPAGVPPA